VPPPLAVFGVTVTTGADARLTVTVVGLESEPFPFEHVRVYVVFETRFGVPTVPPDALTMPIPLSIEQLVAPDTEYVRMADVLFAIGPLLVNEDMAGGDATHVFETELHTSPPVQSFTVIVAKSDTPDIESVQVKV